MRRTVRLKEQPIGKNDEVTPPDTYLVKTDGSLEAVPYKRVSTVDGFLDTGVAHKLGQPTTFIVGDSFVEGMYCDESRRFVAQLAQRLPVNVMNAGYSGMTTLQLLTVVMSKIAGLSQPGDRLVAFVPQSDINPLLSERGYWNATKLYSSVQPPFEANRESSIDDLGALLAALKMFCDGMGIELILGTSPHRVSDFDSEEWVRNLFSNNKLRYENAREKAYEIVEAVRECAEVLGVPLIDLHGKFHARTEFFYDELHLNHAGHDAIAEFIESALN
ncbi:hypothetical protein HMPREF3120_05280 [Corynebacterium sp. HMSC11D10]|uniref:SGNH/GDSL hydrolase family protein n=1 Tax=Corynebacterium sp. HMSC11D10 TaxID=1581088 RepID=UPI0008A54CDD|nr:SGNH/GDSL hydrolase family protein [Corynebacterium sp. HMSC11D10]OFU54971.1 hypothetical protein HMPREF3120_05280 [Corynebacterium sp. HMSC11D10]